MATIFPRRFLSSVLASVTTCAAVFFVPPGHANGFGENPNWNFQTNQDRLNKAAVLDLMEKKKGGYYHAMTPTYNTYIYRQVNCTMSSSTTGNTGINGTTASTSSPVLNNSGSTTSSTDANTASNGLPSGGWGGLVTASLGELAAGSIASSQSNTGSLGSGVTGSNTSATTGPLSANGGVSNQTLSSMQSSAGTLSSSINSSTACAGGILN